MCVCVSQCVCVSVCMCECVCVRACVCEVKGLIFRGLACAHAVYWLFAKQDQRIGFVI